MKKKIRVLLIIPAYNEESNIINTIKSINKGYDYIIINDGSSDNTSLICKENNFSHVNLINNLGIGGAVQTGYKYAYDNDYDIAIQFDGDGQHDSSYINKFIDTIIVENIDLVIGSRFLDNSSQFKSTSIRRVGIKLISFMIRLLSGKRITDPTSGFRAASRPVIELFSQSYPMEYPEPESIITLLKNGYSVKEIPVSMNKRVGGTSSINSWKSLYYMINVCLSLVIVSLKRRIR